MRFTPILLLLAFGGLLLSSCADLNDPTFTVEPGKTGAVATAGDPASSVYINEQVIHSLNPANARIVIDLSDQKARVYRTSGGGRELAIETPVSTGMKGKETPTGEYKILEKLRNKESNLYGVWVDGETGELLARDGDSRDRPSGGDGGAQFQGAPMPYWLKVTPGGAGMHVGYVANNPVSHGCIRVPRRAQALIFEKVGVGTPVSIVL
ncbi:MAG: L,D-transpeptidase family protein [Akkermansiaceae bacterium]|nr:L,D-transpeptidase family protein [Akkermansiaceae bacterium]MCP5550744.1 L,D-transpeptidase family protein [Akkermansiaceae bacterium]